MGRMLASFFLALSSLTSVQAALKYKGVDWSSVIVEEKAGISYTTTSGSAQPLEKIFKESGVNTVRQRVWVNPRDGNYNVDYNLKLAKRAKAAGLGVYVDFHYSDTWADPGHQAIPSGWPTNIDDLAWKLYNYTLDVSNQFAAAGTSPTIISIGNEITSGLLLPTGSTKNFYNVAQLLHSAAWGVKDSKLSPKPRIMIHLDNGWNWNTQKNWYESVLKAGPLTTSDFDMMGVSYYPFYNPSATLSNLKTSLTNMANTWGKEIVVAETNWPTSCKSPAYSFPSDLKSIPFSADGQTTFMKKVAEVVAGVKNGNGLFYWEPAWMDNAGLGSSCESNTMFSWPGKELSSLDVFSAI
ncbi:Arabinogalactan endo-beta-1,4-galactanase [Daldinia childiae]|uniref:Arabinogalactan endo-beta-1,4-galactanase n=1 Tax=Daldinia childiae TaxID=326645 RepID=UPI001448644F|nr:Arabinogalactan endo-beta-1,4-galactanase [Daldinia childiae]KAF3060959.1 Arabinogalactan endo-beta-1,4-galactanase [Daldinia childiae]